MRPDLPPSAALAAVALAAACLLPRCSGEEKTYTAGLVRGARAAETEETRQKLEEVGAALERYAIDHGGYPDASSVAEAEAAVTPAYARSLPREDGWGRPLRLRSGGGDFVVSSDGQDGAAGTRDDLRRESGRRVGAPAP